MSCHRFVREVREEVNITDILLMASIPLVLTLVFLLPDGVQTGLMLDYQNPTAITLFTAAYVHWGFTHFAANVTSYGFLVVPIYLLCLLAGERRLFWYVFLGFVLVFPFAIASVTLTATNPNTGAGFSGIVSAFFGFLPLSLFLFLQSRISDSIRPYHAVVLFLVTAGHITFIYSGFASLTIGIFLVTGLLARYYVSQIGVEELRNAFEELADAQPYLQLVLVSTLLFLLFPTVMFPETLVRDGAATNIIAHYAGFSLGFFCPYLYLLTRQRPENGVENQISSV